MYWPEDQIEVEIYGANATFAEKEVKQIEIQVGSTHSICQIDRLFFDAVCLQTYHMLFTFRVQITSKTCVFIVNGKEKIDHFKAQKP